MPLFDPRSHLRKFAERESLRPDLARATRVTFAAMVPLVLGSVVPLPLNVFFVVFAAQNIAMVDVRGAYGLRVGLLLAMTAVLAAASALGGLVAHSPIETILAAGVVAAAAGAWRHLLPSYGISLAISSTLLFLLASALPPGGASTLGFGVSALAGGLWGLLVQVANWPVNPQHPLRVVVADSWVAVADLFAALAPPASPDRAQRISKAETELRTALDHAYTVVGDLHGRTRPLHSALAELNLAAARVATRVVAFNTALEAVMASPDGGWLEGALQPVLTSLTNSSRGIAVTIVSRQPAHLATNEVRLRRLGHLLRVFRETAAARVQDAGTAAQLRDLLEQLEQTLPAIPQLLRQITEHASERTSFSVELFDLDTWKLRPLASALVLNRKPDAALVRFTLRAVMLTMIGVAMFRLTGLPHGYWLPLTTTIVLQPDYGSTRQRALQRVAGTLVGSVAATALLWLQLPAPAGLIATGGTVFGFAYFVRRNYSAAVFFITLLVVLLTEAHGPVTYAFTGERILSTIGGGVLALLASLYFLPVWERDRLRPILASALDANRRYFELIIARFESGGTYDSEVILAKRKAEVGNSAVFASLQRLMADPRHQREGVQEAAALANGNQRITRALTVLALQLAPEFSARVPELSTFFTEAKRILSALAASLRQGGSSAPLAAEAGALRTFTAAARASADDLRRQAVLAQIPRIATELSAMLLAAQEEVWPAENANGSAPAVPAGA